jgi:general secretion pathway protein I
MSAAPDRPKQARSGGFTLVEVLIALAIISIALAAFVRITSQSATNLGVLEQRSLAMLSAQNSLAELQISALPAPGLRQFACQQADQPFVCRVRTVPSGEGMSTVEVDVYLGRDSDQRVAGLQSRLLRRRR